MSTFHNHQGKSFIRMDILPPDTQKGRTVRLSRGRGEVVDAQFVPVDERTRSVNPRRSQNDNRKQANKPSGLVRRHLSTLEAALKNLPADLFSAMIALVFVGVFTLAGGFSFLFANTGKVEARPVLDITHVSMTPQDADGMRVLLINGIVENFGSDRQAMPSIRADLISGDIVVASTLINTPHLLIEGRQSRGFAARVPHPGGKLPDLRLSFAQRDASRS